MTELEELRRQEEAIMESYNHGVLSSYVYEYLEEIRERIARLERYTNNSMWKKLEGE